MADELFKLTNGEWSMIRSSDSPASWHDKETIIPAELGFEGFRNHPLLGIKFKRGIVRYNIDREGTQLSMPSQHVIFRSDTNQPVAVVSEGFEIHQPLEVFDTLSNVAAKNNLTMDNFGMIRNGSKFWSLARTGNEVSIGGKDIVKQYVLIATAVDGSMATTAKHTSLRVVCSNTLHQSLGNGEHAFKIRHTSKFNEMEIQMNLGLMDQSFSEFGAYANEMHNTTVSVTDAQKWIVELLTDKNSLDDEAVAEFINKSRAFKGFWGGFTQGRGAEQTLWGLVNGVTFTVDHVKGRSFDTRFDSAQFGAGATLKQKAWDKAVAVIEGIKVANDAITLAAA